MTESYRHLRWERTGRTFEVLDDLSQPIPNKFAFSTRVGEKNVDLGSSTFSPYVLDGANLKYGDSQCEFSDGWQTIKHLGQILVSKSRLFIQRDISGVWTDVPHGVPTRNVAHDYPIEGKCTAYLDFPDIQGYAQGARLQVGIEAGGGDQQIYGFRLRSPVAGKFRLEWVLEIPENVDLSWIETPTSKIDTTPIRIGGRIGKTEIRWGVDEAPFRSATIEPDGAGGRILHLFLGPYDIAKMEWLLIYPDTFGPSAIAANADDASQSTTSFYQSGADSDGNYMIRETGGEDWHAGHRWDNVTIPNSATISSAVISLLTKYRTSTTWPKSVTWYGSDEDDAGAFADSASGPRNRTKTTAYVTQTFSSAPTDEARFNTPNLSAIVSEIVSRGSWASGNALILLSQEVADANSAKLQVQDYGRSAGDAASITIIYSAGGASIVPLLLHQYRARRQ